MKQISKESKLKDIDRGYPITLKCVKVFNRNGKLIHWDEAKEVHHWSVVRDYTIKLKRGGEVWLDSGLVKMIVEHELKEKNGKANQTARH